MPWGNWESYDSSWSSPKCRAKNNKNNLSTYQLDVIKITISTTCYGKPVLWGPWMGYPLRIPIPFIGKISGIVPVGPKIYHWLTICEYRKSQWFKQLWYVGWLSTTIMESMPYTKNLCCTESVSQNSETQRNARGTPYHHPTIPPICAISVSVVIFKLDGLSLQFGVAFFSTQKNSRLLGDNCFFSLWANTQH